MNSAHRGHIRPYSSLLAALFRATDILIIITTLFMLAWLLRVQWHGYLTLAGCVAIIVYVITAEVTALYASWRLGSLTNENKQVIITWAAVVFVLLVLAYITKTSSIYSRRVLLTWMISTPLLLTLFRFAFRNAIRALRRKNRNSRSVAVVGAGSQALQLVEQIDQQPWSGLQVEGFYDDELSIGHRPHEAYDLRVLGNDQQLIEKARNKEVDIIFIALPIIKEDKIKELVDGLSNSTVITYVVPDLFMSTLLNTRWGYMGNLPILSIHDRPFTGIDGWLKRLEDLVLGTLILTLITLPMLMIALAIKLTSKGPVIFQQQRYGISGEPISILKFRTMTVCENSEVIIQAKKDDDRVTWLGKRLRRYSLDELPQFINVIQGSMSIVGPRPHAVAHNELYRKEISGYMLRHSIKPGITGWAQINGWRGETDTLHKMEKRIEHDLWYIKNWSLPLDLRIIVLTIFYGFTSDQAY
ncbi:MAG: undecaprenyl-phosphate glucose phosphotransferase [Gammaproteobacteria bacterium]|nr:undecaprenyl-phosphate glucose phosphotransferase [Gammaproteobacteria bacterium]